MKGNRNILLVCIVCACVLGSCRPETGAQTPSTRNGQRANTHTDTALIQLLEINQHMAEEADLQVAHSAKEYTGYTLKEEGWWIKGLRKTGNSLQDGEHVEMHVQIYDLNGTLYEDTAQEFVIGKIEHAQALVNVIGEMEHGQSVSILAPWYVAFGVTGGHHVPPYTNVRIEVEIK